MRIRDHGLLPNAMSLIMCGLLAGVVVAAAAFPILAMAGLATKSGADAFEHLPSDFTIVPAPQTSTVYASDGQTMLASIYDENRKDIPLDQVPKVMQDAIVASEDKEFYNHHGVDLKGILRAVVNNRNGGSQQGGSTLTMQYVRQLVQYSASTPEDAVAAAEKTNGRKLREIKYSIALEKKLPKKKILEGYLNIASFGHAAWGIQAASQVYFGKAPKDLTLAEAALLASLPKAPSDFDLTKADGKAAALERSRNYVLKNMVEKRFITKAQAEAAAKEDPAVVGKRPPQGCTEVQRPELGAGFFCDYLLQWWSQQPDFGDDPYTRSNQLHNGGYTIITSLDMGIQQAAFHYAKERPGAASTGLDSVTAVIMAAVEPGTGRVQAMATNRAFSNDQDQNLPSTNPDKHGARGNRPNTTLPLISGSDTVPGFQSGSVFKMFTVAAALENGFGLNLTFNAPKVAKTKYLVDPRSNKICPGSQYYCAKNDSPGMEGTKNMWSAFGQSTNTYFVPLQEQVGSAKVVDVAKRLGLQFRSKGTKENPSDYEFANQPELANQWGPFTLGVAQSTPLEIANAWATIAADGKYCAATPVAKILDRNGNPVKAGDPHCEQRLAPGVAQGAIDAARCPVGDKSQTARCSGGTASAMRGLVGHPLAGKTGTTESDNIATLTMTTKQLAISGFLVDPDWPNHPSVGNHTIVNQSVGFLMKDAMASKPSIDFTVPPPDIVNGNGKNVTAIPNVKCKDVDAAKQELSKAGFQVDQSGEQVESECPAGKVAGTTPSGQALRGSTVMIQISKGKGGGQDRGQDQQQPPGQVPPGFPGRR